MPFKLIFDFFSTINKKKVLYERVVEPVSRRSALPSDGDELLRNMSIKHLQTMIRDACRGSLAEIEEPDVFEQRIATLESASQFGAALLEFFRAIPKKLVEKSFLLLKKFSEFFPLQVSWSLYDWYFG